jgi:hypothetical protein
MLLNHGCGQVSQVERLSIQIEFAGIGAGEHEQTIDQSAHANRGIAAAFECFFIFFRCPSPRKRQLDLRMQDSQRRAQFVRCIGRETRLSFELPFQPSKGAVEDHGELGEFTVDLGGVDALGKLGGRNAGGRLTNRLNRPQYARRHPPAAEQADHESTGAGSGQSPGQLIEFGEFPTNRFGDKNRRPPRTKRDCSAALALLNELNELRRLGQFA